MLRGVWFRGCFERGWVDGKAMPRPLGITPAAIESQFRFGAKNEALLVEKIIVQELRMRPGGRPGLSVL